jgi:Acetyltransferase (GNAT) domain
MLQDGGLGYRCAALSIDLGDVEALLPVAESQRFGLLVRESMPFGTYGGPLVTRSESRPNLTRAVAGLIRALRSEWSVGFTSATPGPHPHLELGAPNAVHETDVLDLAGGPEALWHGLDKDARNQVRQAERAGVEIGVDNSEQGFRDYYEMLTASAHRWGLPDPGKPWSLFASISRHARDDAVRLWLAKVDGEVAAGSLCFYGAGEVFYWSGAMHERFAKKRPNNLIQWRVIEDAVARGYSDYNMGASGELGGVRKFKQQFGTRTQSYPAYLVRGPVWSAGRKVSWLARGLVRRR